ncbi:hypothetical protein [Streptomyces sp. ITFR-16]|uniref:hypothetical protein n=1 Tax=Streptomyces sp. ITFR-16 TaxID=3075198 RepID=UPI00288AB668|nr:hypothetical protein [Streptomyces sp. ITFR-16]WNI21653.1 hypothetical protein RLT58_06765 [Streptomyces sp. ITFR-16]
MDQRDSHRPPERHRPPEGVTPIYDRLLAEWQAARAEPAPAERTEDAPPCASGLVPAARASGEATRG